jgi:hypothetical protein
MEFRLWIFFCAAKKQIPGKEQISIIARAARAA